MNIKNVAGKCLAARRAAQQQRKFAISAGVLRQVVVDDEHIASFFHEILGDARSRIRRDVDKAGRVVAFRDNNHGIIHRSFFAEGAFGVVGAFAAIALLIGFLRFWRDVGESYSTLAKPGALASAAKDIFTLVNLDNGGDGCSYPTEKSSESRKWFHHATFYGFLSCLIATTLGAVYYFILGQHGPPSFTSLPVIFGIVGGVGLIVGPIGLWVQMQRRNVDIVDRSQTGMELSFILLLLLISITGLLLLAQ